MKNGFTLIELVASIFIVGALSAAILLNYRTGQNKAFLTRAAAAFETDIRRVQNLSVASSEFESSIPCGYGLHYVDNRTYWLYAGRLNGAANCQSSDHNFQSGADPVYQDRKIIEQRVVFRSVFSDIFFEPPDPTTYINNSRSVGASTAIELCLEDDLTNCRNLIIDTAGRVVSQ
ncbi:MAG: type II secretion system protein [Patescibacteria group bacterium]